MSRRLSVAVLAVVVLASAGAPAGGGVPAPAPVVVPGRKIGELEMRWIGPYVRLSREAVGARSTSSVRWFADDGTVAREIAGSVSVQPGFVIEHVNGGTTVHGINADWRLVVPGKPGPSGYTTGTADSRTFVHEFHPEEGQIAADVYVLGKLVGTLGPYEQYLGRDVQLAADGSLALLAWKDREREVAQVVVAGPDGKLRFEVECGHPVDSPLAAPGGAAVLVKPNTGGAERDRFVFYNKEGRVRSLDIGPNGLLVAWVPGSVEAVFCTSVGHALRYQLIDWATGERLWDIPRPGAGSEAPSLPPVAVAGQYFLVSGLEAAGNGRVRVVYAVDLASGNLLAQWRATGMSGSLWDAGRFATRGDRLFLVFDDEFSELNLADIAARANGWQ